MFFYIWHVSSSICKCALSGLFCHVCCAPLSLLFTTCPMYRGTLHNTWALFYMSSNSISAVYNTVLTAACRLRHWLTVQLLLGELLSWIGCSVVSSVTFSIVLTRRHCATKDCKEEQDYGHRAKKSRRETEVGISSSECCTGYLLPHIDSTKCSP